MSVNQSLKSLSFVSLPTGGPLQPSDRQTIPSGLDLQAPNLCRECGAFPDPVRLGLRLGNAIAAAIYGPRERS